MKKTAFKSLAAAFALGALTLLQAPALAQDATLKVEDAWVRATVPSQHATGVFMRLTSSARRAWSASSPTPPSTSRCTKWRCRTTS